MLKKVLILGTLVMIIFSLSACSNSHGIPNGKYVSTSGGISPSTLLRDGINDYDYYWRIKGDKATWYASGLKSFEGKIVKRNGIIFFEDETKSYEIEYDDTTKTLTILSTNVY